MSQITIIISQRYKGFMDQRIGILPFGMGNMNALPGLKCIDFIRHVLAPASEGNKTYPLLIERRQLLVSSKFGVKYQGWIDTPLDLFPEGKKAHHLVIGFLAFDVCRCIEDQLGSRVLGKKSQRPFHCFVPGARPVILQDRFLPKVGDGVKIQIDDAAIVEPKLYSLLDKALLQAQQMNPIEAIGISGYGRALGQHIELSKKPRPRIEGMLRDMSVALSAQKLEGQERQKIAERRDHLGSWQSGLLHHLGQVELLDERSKEKDAGRLRSKRFFE